jgi:hypothetical protein
VIRDRREELVRLHAEHRLRDDAPETNGHYPHKSSHRSDEEIIEKLRAERNGKFDRLWRGDLSDYGHDHSAADDAFVHKSWSYTQEEEQVRRIHAMSGLHRPDKSGRRPDYLRRSIERARKNVTWFYEWPGSVKVNIGQREQREKHSSAPKVEVANERNFAFRTAREIAAATPAHTEWVARPWVAKGAITEIDGKIKAAGKTTFVSHMVTAVKDGKPFMGEPTSKTRVVWLTEQPPTSFRKVLERAGLTECEDVLVLPWHETSGTPWPLVARAAADKALEFGAGLLVVDTLGQFAGIRGDAENSAGAAHEAMEPIQEAAAQGLAVVLTRHERKGGGEVGESGRGSSAFGGAVDIILSLRRAEGNTRPTVRVIESLSRFDETPDKLVIELVDGAYRSLGDATAFAEREAVSAIEEILPASEEHAMPTAEIVDKLKEQNIGRTTVSIALSNLTNFSAIVRVGAGKRGDPYRYYKPALEGSENLSSETPAGSGRKKTHEEQGDIESPDSVDEFLSFGTSTPIAEERKEDREEFVL